MKYSVATSIALLALAGCGQTELPPVAEKISDSDAEVIANHNEVEFRSMDAARIKALYAPDVVAFDTVSLTPITDRAAFDALQDEFATEKFDSIERKDRKIQVLDADTFVVSGTSLLSGQSRPGKDVAMRYTRVYEKQGDGKWQIANEHISLVK